MRGRPNRFWTAPACAGFVAAAGAVVALNAGAAVAQSGTSGKPGYVLATTQGVSPAYPIMKVVLAEGAVASKLKVISWLPAGVVLEDPSGLFDAAASSPGCTNLSPARIRCELAQGHAHMVVDGGAGDDAIDAQFARPAEYNLTVNGGDGSDVIATGPGTNRVYAGQGDDRILGGEGQDYVDGGPGDDQIASGGSFDFVGGGSGDDVIDGSAGRDELDGEEGSDTILYKGRTAPLTITNNVGDDDGEAGEKDDVREMEILLGGPANDVLRGYKTAVTLRGGPGDDQLFGGKGDDTLDGGDGADLLEGGEGVDTTTYSTRTRIGVHVTLNKRPDDGAPDERDDVRTENVAGSAAADRLIGDAGANYLRGLAGNDQLSPGSAGRDRLSGGAGNDVFLARNKFLTLISCGGGRDRIKSRDGGDRLAGDCG